MCDFSQGRLRQQISFLRRQFLQEGELPFSDGDVALVDSKRRSQLPDHWHKTQTMRDGRYSRTHAKFPSGFGSR